MAVLTPQALAQLNGASALYKRLSDCIEAEQHRLERLRDQPDSTQFFMARGRAQAWRAVASALVGIEDTLGVFEQQES